VLGAAAEGVKKTSLMNQNTAVSNPSAISTMAEATTNCRVSTISS
jgi:hypothetical protein